jgi:hypothetical protein
VGSTSTLRSRRCREKAAAGVVRLVVDVDETAVTDLLAHHGLLPAYGTDDRCQLASAFAELMKRLLEADAEQHRG